MIDLSPLHVICDVAQRRSPMPPFEWMVEWMGEPTIRAAWETEADHAASPSAMLELLAMCPSSRVDVARAAAATISSYRSSWLNRIVDRIKRGETVDEEELNLASPGDFFLARALVHLDYYRDAQEAKDFVVTSLTGLSGEKRQAERRRMARVIAAAVPAPRTEEVFALMEAGAP